MIAINLVSFGLGRVDDIKTPKGLATQPSVTAARIVLNQEDSGAAEWYVASAYFVRSD